MLSGFFKVRKTMRALGNLLVWVGLTIGLPSMIYAMTIVAAEEEMFSATVSHEPTQCSVCRHYRGHKNEPPPIQDEDMILVSPGHSICYGGSSSGE
jgi:hypothetical protein